MTMNAAIRALMSQLRHAIPHEDFLVIAGQIVKELERVDGGRDAIEPVLRLMEQNEATDFGMPGCLVHFVERFYGDGYEERLLESIARNPTPHTLWMLNRVANGASGETRQELLAVMSSIADDPNANDVTRHTAKEFLEHQSG
jgi:hypothetical protein